MNEVPRAFTRALGMSSRSSTHPSSRTAQRETIDARHLNGKHWLHATVNNICTIFNTDFNVGGYHSVYGDSVLKFRVDDGDGKEPILVEEWSLEDEYRQWKLTVDGLPQHEVEFLCADFLAKVFERVQSIASFLHGQDVDSWLPRDPRWKTRVKLMSNAQRDKLVK